MSHMNGPNPANQSPFFWQFRLRAPLGTMGAGAAVFRGDQAKLIAYTLNRTLMNPRYGHMIVDGRVTAEDEDTLMANLLSKSRPPTLRRSI